MNKKCTKCGEDKSIADYHIKHSKPISQCKRCRLKTCAAYREVHRLSIRLKDRLRNLDPSHKNRRRAYLRQFMSRSDNREKYRHLSARYKRLHPEIVIAQRKVRMAIRRGLRALQGYEPRDVLLFRPDECEKCFKKCKPQAHHWSYLPEHWYDVKFLCSPCHVSTESLHLNRAEDGKFRKN